MKYEAFKINFPSELLEIKFHEEQVIVFEESKYLLVYVGIANKMSLQKRIMWHVDDSHSLAKIKSKTLSTLRQSLSSILFKTWNCKDDLDNFMKKNMIVDCEPVKNYEILEKELIAKYILPLNIQHNNHEELKSFKKKLKSERKQAREKAIEEFIKNPVGPTVGEDEALNCALGLRDIS